jgi:fatty-acid peroxygenase
MCVMGWPSYTSILERRARNGTDVFEVRLLGRRVICMGGAQAARLFYDETRFARHGALPGFVQKTLVGQAGVQTLDGLRHRYRKRLFTEVVTDESVERLAELVAAEWRDTLRSAGRFVLFDEAARVLTRATVPWAGMPMPAAGADALAHNLTATVDGFATIGPRNWRGRMARARTEMWAQRVIEDVRQGNLRPAEGTAARVAAMYKDMDGRLLDRQTAAVELLNVVRPTVAIAWYVTFVAHALRLRPEWRERLRDADEPTITAFTEEVRRFYPFAPFLAAKVIRDFEWSGLNFWAGDFALLDVYGTDHDPDLWEDPESFEPERFLLGHAHQGFGFIPQGGGDVNEGHRCPGEPITLRLIKQAAVWLSGLEYEVPPQDLEIRLDRIPARVRSGFVMEGIRAAAPITG